MRRVLLVTFMPALALLFLVQAAAIHYGNSVTFWTRDPTATAHVHPLTGCISVIGNLFWCAAAAISAFAAWAMIRLRRRHDAYFAASAAALSFLLLMDDLFQFHESLAEEYLGVDEIFVYVLLVAAAGAHLWFFRKRIFEGHWRLLAASLCLLGGSVLLDLGLDRYLWAAGDLVYLLEDGLKLLGIAAWCSFHAVRFVEALTAQAGGAPSG
jgi:hypothetical protein